VSLFNSFDIMGHHAMTHLDGKPNGKKSQEPGRQKVTGGNGTPPLGNNTKSSSALAARPSDLPPPPPLPKRVRRCFVSDLAELSSRAVRFFLLEVARFLLMIDARRRGIDFNAGEYAERTAYCHHVMLPNAETVDVLHHPETESAGYRGLMTCASVWACPVCSAKITERRRAELSQAVADWPGSTALVTLTVQHTRMDLLAPLLADLKAAYSHFFSGRPWRRLAAQFGVVGRVRGLEGTNGVNGWHPHIHVLLFLTEEVDKDALESCLQPLWAAVVAKHGRYASRYYGLTVRVGGDAVATYIAKMGLEEPELTNGESGWTLTHELVKAVVKQAKRGGRTPLQLLADYATGDTQAGELWLEYYWAFKGQKQLVWSKGLRALLGLDDELTDEEIEALEEESSVVLAQLSPAQWRVIVRKHAQAALLDAAATGDKAAVYGLLAELGALEGQPPP
jgi:hypothetical protein